MLYQLLKNIVAICFNLLNILLGGNLPPLVCVSTIVEDNDRYLLIRSEGKHTFPGGFMRWSENPMQAAIREGKEETGLELSIGDIVGYQSYRSRTLKKMSTLNLIYHAKIISGTLQASIEGQPVWLYEKELHGKLEPLAQDMFDLYLSYRTQQNLAKKLMHHN